jgi:putative ABC transport system substrate-binding protein
MSRRIERRAFIGLVGGAAAWPLVARAQKVGRVRRVGILLPFAESDREIQDRVQAFKQEFQSLGWMHGGNVQLDERWTGDDMDLIRASAAGLLAAKPDAILATGGRVIPVLLQMTRSVPIVVPGAGDPVGTGWVASLARPGGNLTGFSLLEVSVIGKMLEILKQIVPAIVRVTAIYNPDNPNSAFYRQWFESFAKPLTVEPIVAPIHQLADIERAIEAVAQVRNGGAFFPPDVTVTRLRAQVAEALIRRRVPSIFAERSLAASGGLASYGTDRVDLYRRAASYVDRILRGEKPGDLPFQQPIKYELVINLKTANALGLTVPPMLLAQADEVIE